MDPWDAAFAFVADSSDDLKGTWIKITLSGVSLIAGMAWIQFEYANIRRTLVTATDYRQQVSRVW